MLANRRTSCRGPTGQFLDTTVGPICQSDPKHAALRPLTNSRRLRRASSLPIGVPFQTQAKRRGCALRLVGSVVAVAAVPPDYDSDPGRSRSFLPGWQEDVHRPVADRLIAEGVESVLDVGCGIGRFGASVLGRVRWIGLDESARQIGDCSYRPVVRGDARFLPFGDESFDAVVMLWMLYHLDEPLVALREARRVVRRGGLVAVCTSSRSNDPELVPGGYPPTPFDAEEAVEIVGLVFGESNVEVEHWDSPMVRLKDRDEVAAYVRSHLLPSDMTAGVTVPLLLTKRGCLAWARRP